MLNSLTVLSVFALGGFARASGCLCTYGDPCWPDVAAFAQLESQVSQPLIYPIPTASACYPTSDPSGNCSEVIQNWTDDIWRSSIPGSMQFPNFETFEFKNGTISACYLNTSLEVPCEQGNVPVIGVDARTPNDIQAAVDFAIQYNLKLVVKNTGLVKISSAPDYRDLHGCSRHDFLGRSAARGAFVVWTHNMKNITYDATFTPQGGPLNETYEGNVFSCHCAHGNSTGNTIHSCNTWRWRAVVRSLLCCELVRSHDGWWNYYWRVHRRSWWLASRWRPQYSIAYLWSWYGYQYRVGSYSQGYFDSGVDNAIEITVVTSTGEHLTVNDYYYSDLFWALRGGGGGTYGVITSVTYRTYESLPVASYFVQANVTNTTALKELTARMLQLQTNLTDDGWGGYGSLSNLTMNFLAIAPNMSIEAANASIQPWTEYLQSPGISSVAEMSPIPSWYEWYMGQFNISGGTGVDVLIATRLLSRDTTANQSVEVAEILVDCEGGIVWVHSRPYIPSIDDCFAVW